MLTSGHRMQSSQPSQATFWARTRDLLTNRALVAPALAVAITIYGGLLRLDSFVGKYGSTRSSRVGSNRDQERRPARPGDPAVACYVVSRPQPVRRRRSDYLH